VNTSWLHVLLAAFAVWRVTHLFAYEDGPWDVVVRVRAALGAGAVGRLFDCFNCLSIWVAAPLALAVARSPREWTLAWLGLSGVACLIERTTRPPVVMHRLDTEDQPHGLLRTASSGAELERTIDAADGDHHAGVLRPAG
jgi:hypothetical protein